MVLVETQRFFLHIMQLLKYDCCSDDQNDGNSELYYHQYFSERDIASTCFKQTLQCFNRLK